MSLKVRQTHNHKKVKQSIPDKTRKIIMQIFTNIEFDRIIKTNLSIFLLKIITYTYQSYRKLLHKPIFRDIYHLSSNNNYVDSNIN